MTPETAPQMERYVLDATASKFTVQAFAEGLFSAFGHDPVIGIRDLSGEAEFVADTFENASLKLRFNARSMMVTNNLKEKDRQEIEQTMRGEVLEVDKYPEITFESRNISMARAGQGRYRARVIGDLTLHGVTQQNLWINGEVTMSDDGLRVKGNCAVKQTDYKIKLVSVAGGTLKNKNEVQCTFDLVARNAL